MYDLPQEFFPHDVTIVTPDGGWDEWDVPSEPQKPVTDVIVTGVKVSTTISGSRSNTSLSDTSNAIMYVSPQWSSKTDFEKGQEIHHDGQKYVIGKIHTLSQPYSNDVHHWKVELK